MGWWEQLPEPDKDGNVAFWVESVFAHYPNKCGVIRSVGVEETRITDANTGGQKGTKLARFDLIPPEAHWALAEVYGKGCEKYVDRNWEKGYKWGLSVAALERHLNLWKQGESIDKETGCYHLMQVAWHAFALFTYELRCLGTDDVRVSSLVSSPLVQPQRR